MVTTVRILLTPVMIVAIYLYAPSWWLFVAGFALTFTDRIDGWLARRYGTSNVGTFLDPLSDKFLVIGSFIAIVALGWLSWIPVALITAREVLMSVWRSRYAAAGKPPIPARKSAKYKMWVQSWAVAFALIPGVMTNVEWLFHLTVWLAVAFTYVTLGQYIIDARRTGDPTGATPN